MLASSSVLLVVVLFFTSPISSKPPNEAKSRDEISHFADDPERHDTNFDHQAFLGSERVREFSKLTPEQSALRLKELFKKIDLDKDGQVTENEMKVWIAHVAEESQKAVTNDRWSKVNPEGQDPLPCKKYIENAYGNVEERMKEQDSGEYARVALQDRRRWEAADQNKDDALSKEEFLDFIHPEDKAHMRDSLIDEILDGVDTDKDGKVTEKEYLDDLARAYQTILEPGKPEPEWVERERDQYRKYRDIDQNGLMDRREVGEWIMPTDYDPIEAETQHLFYHADKNKDNRLSEAEIVEHQDLFVNSQATNYGNAMESHEEL